ncbi:hypothetical protein N7931_09680 [Catenovulum sp. 2E275]|uniref:hypothetical protein n=1 Tax=Catenovulum sp. 2E275 TaxID=2980497 RepID=UPI0021CF9B29|nr:hypothetical protein [Catenovulum sp. 2E275]MCU4675905.1 hypothetical protein [Catenovulum sp. 2E275]
MLYFDEPDGYAYWYKHKKLLSKKSFKLFVALTVIMLGLQLICTYFELNLIPDYVTAVITNPVLFDFTITAVIGYLGIWVSAKFNLEDIICSFEQGCLYREKKNERSIESLVRREPKLYLNDIKHYQFELIKWKGYQFYVCRIKLKPMKSNRYNTYQFGIPVKYFEKNKDLIEKQLNQKMTLDELMSASLKR